MLPANMFGETRSNTFGCVTRSPCRRSSGMPVFHALSPTFRYDTSTLALRFDIAVDQPLEAQVDQRRRFDDRTRRA